jgi:hypothetical protein
MVRSDNLSKVRVGVTGVNTYGSVMEIIEYNSTSDIWVKFISGNSIHTTWQAFIKGNVKNPYDKTVYGIGYLGEGKYKSSRDVLKGKQYIYWRSMMKRCYSEKYNKQNKSYRDVTVCEEWHNFQNFAKWFDENFYEIDREVMCLDKDILVKSNKVYSPETCVFVPHHINTLFIKNESKRKTLPIGVHLRKDNTNPTYRVRCGNGKGEDVDLGQFKTIEEAFNTYKSFKEKLIKQTADGYRTKIPYKLYNALINYSVEITD